MMNKRNKAKFCLIGLILLTGILFQCRFGSENKSSNTIETEFRRGNNLNAKDWRCYDIENNKICIPSEWNFTQQSVGLFFASLNEDKNTYFGVIKTNKLDANQYLKEGYAQLKRDSLELFAGYTLKRLVFKNKETYYGEYFTKIKKTDYFAYSMVFEQNGFVYDVGLKLKKQDSPKYRDIFKNILFNIKIDGKAIFDEFDKIEKIDTVDLSKL